MVRLTDCDITDPLEVAEDEEDENALADSQESVETLDDDTDGVLLCVAWHRSLS